MTDYNQSNFQQPLELFLSSLMKGPMHRYEEPKAKIINLFQVPRGHRGSHFTALHILGCLSSCRHDTDNPDCPVTELFAAMNQAGHGRAEIKDALTRLGKRHLVVSRSHPEPPWPEDATVRIGGAGEYYLATLVRNREYVRSIVDDTFLYDRAVHTSIKQAHNNRDLKWHERADQKTRVFLAYLIREEQAELGHFPDGRRPQWLHQHATGVAESLFGSEFVGETMGVPSNDRKRSGVRPRRRRAKNARRRGKRGPAAPSKRS